MHIKQVHTHTHTMLHLVYGLLHSFLQSTLPYLYKKYMQVLPQLDGKSMIHAYTLPAGTVTILYFS